MNKSSYIIFFKNMNLIVILNIVDVRILKIIGYTATNSIGMGYPMCEHLSVKKMVNHIY